MIFQQRNRILKFQVSPTLAWRHQATQRQWKMVLLATGGDKQRQSSPDVAWRQMGTDVEKGGLNGHV
ncbi:hypothetical protein A2U01_0041303 [Trifolium medium]|uniref:Uncharacterized protein n=1 Tax=Trifolium medium TaxID=97028 RepID=A0A392Q8D0_9FABA|nr:hypothetical protein [Trifolium medium]